MAETFPVRAKPDFSLRVWRAKPTFIEFRVSGFSRFPGFRVLILWFSALPCPSSTETRQLASEHLDIAAVGEEVV